MAEIKKTNEEIKEVQQSPENGEQQVVVVKETFGNKVSKTVAKGLSFGKKHWKKAAAVAGAGLAAAGGYAIGKKFGVPNVINTAVDLNLSKEDLLEAAGCLTDDIIDTTVDEVIDTVEESNIVEDVITEILS